MNKRVASDEEILAFSQKTVLTFDQVKRLFESCNGDPAMAQLAYDMVIGGISPTFGEVIEALQNLQKKGRL